MSKFACTASTSSRSSRASTRRSRRGASSSPTSDEDDAPLVNPPRHRARLAGAPAVLVEQVADVGARSVAIVGQGLDEDRGPAGAVALIEGPLDLRVGAAGSGPPVDRPLDVLLWHRVA